MTNKCNSSKALKKKVHRIIQACWQADTFDKESIDSFYNDVKNQFELQLYDYRSQIVGRRHVSRFIKHINQSLDRAHKLPIPSYFESVTREVLSFDTVWLHNGKSLVSLVENVITHWSDTIVYSTEEKIGWLVFSAIFFGGINHKPTLSAYIKTLVNHEFKADATFDWATMVNVTYQSNVYGNDYASNGSLQATQQIIIDNVTRLWLVSLQTEDVVFDASKLEHYLKTTLHAFSADEASKTNYSLSFLCRYASYVWQQHGQVDIDMALVNVMRGKIKTVGLTKTDFNLYCEQRFKAKNISRKPINLSRLIREKVWKAQAVHKHSKGNQNSYPKNKRITTSQHVQLSLTDTNRLHRHIITATKSDKPIERLRRCLDTPHLMAVRFINWLIALFESGKLKRSSIQTYVSSIGRTLLQVTRHDDVDDFDADDYSDVYDAILEYKQDKSVSYRAHLLYRFHKFQQGQYDAPETHIPYLPKSIKIAAQLISPALFQQFLYALDKRLPPEDAVVFKLIYILAYRAGMRKSEILGLSYRDVEYRYSTKPNLIIRANKHRSLKSSTARRRIPLNGLLKQDELALFIDYLSINMPTKSKLGQAVFTLSSNDLPLDNHLPLNLLKTVMSDILKNDGAQAVRDNSMTFHTLRHTAITNMSLVFNAPDLASQFTDYNQEDVRRIRESQLGFKDTEQLGWYALASMVGHLSPRTTFQNYFHLAYLCASYRLYQSEYRIPVSAVLNITGLTRPRLRDNLISSQILDDETDESTKPFTKLGDSIEIHQLSKLLYKLTNAQNKVRSYSSMSPRHPSLMVDTRKALSPEARQYDLFKGYGLGRILKLLQRMEQQQPLHSAAKAIGIEIEDAQRFYQNAHALTHLKTQKGHSRLFTKRVKTTNSVNGIRLLPKPLSNIHDRKLLFHVYHHARQMHHNDPIELQSFIEVLLSKITTRDAFISFPVKHKHQMLSFIESAVQLLSEKYWLVQVPDNEAETAMFKTLQNSFSQINTEIRHVETYRVGIVFSGQKQTKDKQFSTMLRYLGHVLGIVTYSEAKSKNSFYN